MMTVCLAVPETNHTPFLILTVAWKVLLSPPEKTEVQEVESYWWVVGLDT